MNCNILTRRTNGVLKTGAVVFGLLGSTLYATGATANTGAGASILNVAQVTWEDSGANSFAETATSEVTVTVTASAPTLNAPADGSATSGSDVTYSYTITSTANGSDTYDLSSGSTLSNLDASTVTINGGTTNITLGASVLLSVNDGTDTITIPAGSETNLTAGDPVDINGTTFFVKTVTGGTQASHVNTASDGAAGVTTPETVTSIVLDDGAGGAVDLTAAAVAAGQTINEQLTFNVVVNGDVTAGNASGTDTVVLTATDGANPTTDTTVSTFNLANLSISKTVSTDGGTTFAATANAASGATLTYRIEVANPSTTESALLVEITDVIAAYTTYTAGDLAESEIGLTAGLTDTFGDAGNTSLTDTNADGDNYDSTAGTITYSIGTLAASSSAILFYQVTID